MVGMLQILTYLLCCYLVYKGVEIFQIAYCSTSPKRKSALVVGVFAIIFSVMLSLIFILLQDKQAASISNSMPGR